MNIKNIRKLTRGQIQKDVRMSQYTTFRIGGTADWMVSPYDAREAAALVRYFHMNHMPYYVMGNGSNLLVSDQGYRGVILDLGRNDGTAFTSLGYDWLDAEGNSLHTALKEAEAGDTEKLAEAEGKKDILEFDVGAGCLMSSVGSFAARFGGSGFEPLSGIPGCVGGACIMNAGAYEQEIGNLIHSVEAITPKGEIVTLGREELEFRYRGSSLMDQGYIVSRATLRLKKDAPEAIQARNEDYAARRKEKQPLEYPSAGSTFKRPEGAFAGKLISDAGLKGYTIGGAQVSEKHSGFIINRGGATAADVRALIRYVQEQVEAMSGIRLEPEVRFLGEF